MSGIVMTRTMKDIIRELEMSPSPLSKRELADKIDVVYQTIQNHLPRLIQHGFVRESIRKGNTTLYELSDPADSLAPVEWNGEFTTIIKLCRELAEGKVKTGNQFSRAIANVFAGMLIVSANALEDDNPKPLTVGQVKEFQATISKIFGISREIEKTCRSLLDNDTLWNPATLPSELILKDPTMSLGLARSIAQGVKESIQSS